MLQMSNVATISVPEQPSPQVYAYGNDTHNVAKNVLLIQQLFRVLFFSHRVYDLRLYGRAQSGYQIMCTGLV